MNTLLWFQRDLRLTANPALDWALQQDMPVIAIYIHSPEEDEPWAAGAASRWWLHHSLEKLHSDLQKLNIELQFFHDNSQTLLPRLTDFYAVQSVTWTNRHEPQRMTYEKSIEDKLLQKGVTVRRFKDELLNDPDRFLTKTSKTPYRVFTPFYKRLRGELNPAYIEWPQQVDTQPLKVSIPFHEDACSLQQLGLVDKHQWHKKFHQYWTPGEASALDKLHKFIDNELRSYPVQRDYPAYDGTSGLSPHMHFGEISPGQILSALLPIIEYGSDSLRRSAEVFLRQLIWREFARYILFHFPETAQEPMNKRFSKAFWRTNPEGLQRWQRGQTGIAIIDAGMKQLWETGTMHNRVRMLVASLLTKNMGIHWQDGAQWFWQTLVDADLANNSMGWQWVAGCGVDAAPYFRIFNPDIQAKRFDANHQYRQQWTDANTTDPRKDTTINLAVTRQYALDHYNDVIRGKR
jgi:deoxyribodipyrimidine photo-lyase